MRKYLNIGLHNESDEIGVIAFDGYTNANDFLSKSHPHIERRLLSALESHFDCPVKIRSISNKTSLGSVRFSGVVVVEAMDEDRTEAFELNETWLYAD